MLCPWCRLYGVYSVSAFSLLKFVAFQKIVVKETALPLMILGENFMALPLMILGGKKFSCWYGLCGSTGRPFPSQYVASNSIGNSCFCDDQRFRLVVGKNSHVGMTCVRGLLLNHPILIPFNGCYSHLCILLEIILEGFRVKLAFSYWKVYVFQCSQNERLGSKVCTPFEDIK